MKITLTQFRPNTAEAVWTDCFAQAIAALHKAGGGVLTVPTGEYSTGPIELCSNMELHLEPGAVIRFLNDPAAFPLQECQYEGRISHRPKPCLSAFNAENVALTGSGVLDGCGAPWWAAQRARTLANGRPYLLHFENVTHLRVCGVQLRNSPAWTVHPLNCVDVLIEDVSICNPYNSPNTDGINPESCRDVRILNCRVDVGDDCINALYEAIEARSIRPGICKTAGLKLVYSPLNGSGLVPVTHVLHDIGITDITVVPEQEKPDGNFPTCPYPNPEIFEALRLGLELAEKSGADLMLATDPDADRVGIAVKCKDGSYELLSGNEVGVLLLDYICAGRIEQGTMPKDPVMCKSIVSTPLADKVAEHYGVECRNVLTGFKWIGDQIAKLEAAGQVDRFIFGFEESYGYLAGPYVRDKDAIIGSMLICEMAAYYRAKGSSIKEELERIYAEYGRYLNKVDSFEFPGLSGMDKMVGIMSGLRENPPKDFGGDAVVKVVDYKKPEETGLPAANVLIYTLASGCTVVVRPSGTEPKIKFYFGVKGTSLEDADQKEADLGAAVMAMVDKMM